MRIRRLILALGLASASAGGMDLCWAQSLSSSQGDSAGAGPRGSGEPSTRAASAQVTFTEATSTEIAPATKFVDPDRQNILAQLWKRRIISPKTDLWSSEDLALLKRIQRAEAMDAFRLLREELGSLRGLVVEHEVAARRKKVWLLKAGFERYLFLKSQRARRYFEGIGPDAKWVFQIRALDGERLFDGRGLLTESGEELYDRIVSGDKVQWREPSGEIKGNFRSEARPAAPVK